MSFNIFIFSRHTKNTCLTFSTVTIYQCCVRTDENKPFAIDRQKPDGAGFYSEDLSYKEFKVKHLEVAIKRKRWKKSQNQNDVRCGCSCTPINAKLSSHRSQLSRGSSRRLSILWGVVSLFCLTPNPIWPIWPNLILKIKRKSKVPLEAVPYSEEYKDHLSKSADFLKEVKHFSALRLVLILIFSFIIMCSLLSNFPLLHFMIPSPGCGQDGQPFAGQVSQSTSSGTFSSLIDCLDGFFACFCLSLCGFSQVCNWCSPPTTKAFMDNEYGESDRLWLDVDSRLSWSSSISHFSNCVYLNQNHKHVSSGFRLPSVLTR